MEVVDSTNLKFVGETELGRTCRVFFKAFLNHKNVNLSLPHQLIIATFRRPRRFRSYGEKRKGKEREEEGIPKGQAQGRQNEAQSSQSHRYLLQSSM
jgi:hypothetical protein